MALILYSEDRRVLTVSSLDVCGASLFSPFLFLRARISRRKRRWQAVVAPEVCARDDWLQDAVSHGPCPASRPWRATSPSCDSTRGGCRARREAKPGQVRGAHRERQRGPVAAGVSRHASRINFLLTLHDDGAPRVARAGPRLYAPGAAPATQSAPGYARCDADGDSEGPGSRPVLPLPAVCDR